MVAVNPPLGQFSDLISFHPGGVDAESRPYLVKPTPLVDLLETRGAARGRGPAGGRSKRSSAS